MKAYGAGWWGFVIGGSALLSAGLYALFDSRQPPSAEPLRIRGSYQLYTEKLQDGTFCVIVTNYSHTAMACDFTCRSPEGNLCE